MTASLSRIMAEPARRSEQGRDQILERAGQLARAGFGVSAALAMLASFALPRRRRVADDLLPVGESADATGVRA